MSQIATLATVLTLFVAACGASSPKSEPPPQQQPAARTAADLGPMCKRHYARQRTCVDDYLSALLDVRIELDMPPGIGDEVEAKGRDAVLAIAHAEFQRDTEPARVDAICEAMATKTPAEHVERLLKAGDECEATKDCKAFAACAVATERSYIASGAQH